MNTHNNNNEQQYLPSLLPTTKAMRRKSKSQSLYGLHRQKHTLRFLFRTVSFLVLVGGYALSNYWRGGLNGAESESGGLVDGESGGGESWLRRRLSEEGLSGEYGESFIIDCWLIEF